MIRPSVRKMFVDRSWRVHSRQYPNGISFDTWQEAIDYADKQARTYEVVLPRATYGDHVVAGKGLYSLHVDHMPHCTDIFLGGWGGIIIENRHLWDLAMYLAACAQHWEDNK